MGYFKSGGFEWCKSFWLKVTKHTSPSLGPLPSLALQAITRRREMSLDGFPEAGVGMNIMKQDAVIFFLYIAAFAESHCLGPPKSNDNFSG